MSPLRKKRTGSTSVELMLLTPLFLTGIAGTMYLFTAYFARQRTYTALPELGRMASKGDFAPVFRVHRQALATTAPVVKPSTGLTPEELKYCGVKGYIPPHSALSDVRFEVKTTNKYQIMRGLPDQTTINTYYGVTRRIIGEW